jgi:hypothetical protein
VKLAFALVAVAVAPLGCGKGALTPHPAPTGAAGQAAAGAAGQAAAGAAGQATAPSGAGGAAGSAEDAAAPSDVGDAAAGGGAAASPADADAASASDADGSSLFPSDAGALPPERYRALTVVAGRYHTCAILDDHRVKCWGDNGYGQLGLGDTKNRQAAADMGDNLPTVDLGTGRTAKALTAGRYATCALLDDDSVKCWGWEQLAWGQNLMATEGGNIGDEPGEMGDALPRVDLGGHKARLVALGYYDGCIVKDDESLHCWSSGAPSMELPPYPKRITRLAEAAGVLALFEDGSFDHIYGSPNAVPAAPVVGGARVPAVFIAGSRTEACAVFANGDSACGAGFQAMNGWWSSTITSQLVVATIVETSSFWCGILRDGHVVCPNATSADPWDNDVGPDFRFVRLGQPAVAITGGANSHYCAALLDGEVKCWPTYVAPSYETIYGLGGTVATETDWPSVDLGTRPH